MDKLFYIVKIIAITELILVVLLLILSYGMKIFFHFKEKHNIKISTHIDQQLEATFNGQIKLSDTMINFFKSHLLTFLINLSHFEAKKNQFINWDNVIKQLSDVILKPQARVLSTSRQWFKRYLAVLCFSYGFDPEDGKLLKKLLNDDNLLISINTARVIAEFPLPELITAVVYSFAKGRRLQQAANAEILAKGSQDFSPAIIEILQKTQDPYVKSFCYRLLTQLLSSDQICSTAESDVLSENITLKIAVLNYLGAIKNKAADTIILKFIHDPHWEVRAVVTRILGERGDESAIAELEKSLKDPIWWVRVNAANSLLKLGKKGIAVLKAQSPEIDRYAYETAQEVLKIVNTTEGN